MNWLVDATKNRCTGFRPRPLHRGKEEELNWLSPSIKTPSGHQAVYLVNKEPVHRILLGDRSNRQWKDLHRILRHGPGDHARFAHRDRRSRATTGAGDGRHQVWSPEVPSETQIRQDLQ